MTITLPHGYYAVSLHDTDEYDPDDPRYCEHIGYHLVEVNKRGRIRRSAQKLDGITDQRITDALKDAGKYDPWGGFDSSR